MKNYMVFDIGGSSIKWSVITENGDFKENGSIKTPDNKEGFFQSLENITNEMKEKFNVEGIAISAPGAVDSVTGIIGGLSAIPYIHGPNFKEILKESTGLNVAIENDANCAALGECWLGAGKENNDMAFIVCGTGIGGAIVKDRKLHVGVHKHGGEFGYCSVSCTFELCEKGDEIALKEVDKYYYTMAVGIYNIQYTYDPEVIILGGAISEREDYVNQINKHMEYLMKNTSLEGTIVPSIKKCKYGNDANKLGALYNYFQSVAK